VDAEAQERQAMTERLQKTILDSMPPAVRREALRCRESGVRYLAYGVVWGAYGPGTAFLL
jgi:hypothetical protein